MIHLKSARFFVVVICSAATSTRGYEFKFPRTLSAPPATNPADTNVSSWCADPNARPYMVSTPAVVAGRDGTTISQLSDPTHSGVAAYIDILSASIVQNGGVLTFVAETRGVIPASVSGGGEFIRFIWFVDADQNSFTGQPHGSVGSEFNVRAVIDPSGINGYVDVTGALPGGGLGSVTIVGNRIEMAVRLPQIASPGTYSWATEACAAIGGPSEICQPLTSSATATTLPYSPPASVELFPPLLMLSPTGPSTGQLQVTIRDEAGNVLDNADYQLSFSISNENVATVDGSGLVTVHATPAAFNDTPYVTAFADGIPSSNASVIRSTATDFGLSHQVYPGQHVEFYLPPLIEGVDLDALTQSYQVVEAADLAYLFEQIYTRTVTFGGGTQQFVLDIANDGTEPCGLSGNPVRLGWQYGTPIHNSCYIVNDPAHRVPQWFIMWHEMGHNFTLQSTGFVDFAFSYGPLTGTYIEGLATLAAMTAWKSIETCAPGLTETVRMNIAQETLSSEQAFRGALAAHQNSGVPYDNMNPDVLDGMLLELHDDFGNSVWFDFFSCFLPQNEPLSCAITTREQQATFFVAAFSVSTGQDLRSRFATDYGFPIDNAAWPTLLSCAQVRIAARPYASVDSDGDGILNTCDPCPTLAGPSCSVPAMSNLGGIVLGVLWVTVGGAIVKKKYARALQRTIAPSVGFSPSIEPWRFIRSEKTVPD
ncbi:MAG: hypothetical protein AABZ47_10055 [Planctomycetota bacterium]